MWKLQLAGVYSPPLVRTALLTFPRAPARTSRNRLPRLPPTKSLNPHPPLPLSSSPLASPSTYTSTHHDPLHATPSIQPLSLLFPAAHLRLHLQPDSLVLLLCCGCLLGRHPPPRSPIRSPPSPPIPIPTPCPSSSSSLPRSGAAAVPCATATAALCSHRGLRRNQLVVRRFLQARLLATLRHHHLQPRHCHMEHRGGSSC